MKLLSFIFSLCLSIIFSLNVHAKEYGGRWDDESIREYLMKYIDLTKAQFEQRALRLSKVTDSPFLIKYAEFTAEQKEVYEKFLADRINDRDRETILRVVLKDLEAVRAKLAEAEKKAYEVWEKLPKDVQAEKAAEVRGEVYGTEMSSSNLGVLLDNSPSMKPYLDTVREEIKKIFPNAHFREAAESGLHLEYGVPIDIVKKEFGDAWFYAEIPPTGVNPFDQKWHQTKIYENIEPHYRQVGLERNALHALIALIKLQEADTVYWFCDFEDDIEPHALKMLKEAVAESKVKLYVHSSNRRPKKALTQIIEDSGGEVIRKRIR